MDNQKKNQNEKQNCRGNKTEQRAQNQNKNER